MKKSRKAHNIKTYPQRKIRHPIHCHPRNRNLLRTPRQNFPPVLHPARCGIQTHYPLDPTQIQVTHRRRHHRQGYAPYAPAAHFLQGRPSFRTALAVRVGQIRSRLGGPQHSPRTPRQRTRLLLYSCICRN